MNRTHHEEVHEGRAEKDAGAGDPFEGIGAADVLDTARAFAREHPHAALAGACLAGFVLGGGVTPRLLGAASLMLARRYFRMAVVEATETLRAELLQQSPRR